MVAGDFFMSVLEFCFPNHCPCCHAFFENGGPLCSKCTALLGALAAESFCEQCGRPVPMRDGPCPHCRDKGMPNLARVVRLGAFRDPLKSLVHLLKYRGRWPMGEFLADRLIDKDSAKELLMESDVLVATPLHPIRQFERGYNQAAVIAQHLARRCTIEICVPIARIRHTETQTHQHSPSRREENLRDAFALVDGGSPMIRGRHVVIVDDVLTTGATLRAISQLAVTAKPASVSAIVIGVADPRGTEPREVGQMM